MTTNANDTGRKRIRRCVSCLQCKGICHEGSLKKKILEGYGFRSHYFCSYHCMKIYFELKYYSEYESICARQGKMDKYEEAMEEMAQKTLERYEYVDMITE